MGSLGERSTIADRNTNSDHPTAGDGWHHHGKCPDSTPSDILLQNAGYDRTSLRFFATP